MNTFEIGDFVECVNAGEINSGRVRLSAHTGLCEGQIYRIEKFNDTTDVFVAGVVGSCDKRRFVPANNPLYENGKLRTTFLRVDGTKENEVPKLSKNYVEARFQVIAKMIEVGLFKCARWQLEDLLKQVPYDDKVEDRG